MSKRSTFVVLVLTAAVAGCTSSGRNFDAGQLSMLSPGMSTLADATHALGATPVTLYGQLGGGVLALWSYHATWVVDGLYGRKQVLLHFGADGRLLSLVDSTNVLLQPWERRKLLGVPQTGPGVPTVSAMSRPTQLPSAR